MQLDSPLGGRSGAPRGGLRVMLGNQAPVATSHGFLSTTDHIMTLTFSRIQQSYVAQPHAVTFGG